VDHPSNGSRDRYRLYVDESGDHAYRALDDPAHRYLALLGVWFRQEDHYVRFVDELEALKRQIFGPRPDKPVILHRSDIIGRKGPFGLLSDVKPKRDFDQGLLDVIGHAVFVLAAVIIDKREHVQRYAKPSHPYHYCLAALLDRYSGWLNYYGAVGDVMAEARGKKEDRLLEAEYTRIYAEGTLQFPASHHQRALTSREIKMRPKAANIAGLQLADILAYPVKQMLLFERGRIPDPGDVYGKHLYRAIENRFNKNYGTGRVRGYGQIWLP